MQAFASCGGDDARAWPDPAQNGMTNLIKISSRHDRAIVLRSNHCDPGERRWLDYGTARAPSKCQLSLITGETATSATLADVATLGSGVAAIVVLRRVQLTALMRE